MKTNYPETHLLNSKFVYTPSVNTDIRKTFEAAAKKIKKEKSRELLSIFNSAKG
jgi:hypothetical protein